MVELKKLPKCDVCQFLGLAHVMDATADSLVNFRKLDLSQRNCWAYTCEVHKELRIGTITHLEVADVP